MAFSTRLRRAALAVILTGCAESSRPIRIVVVTLDTLRYDRFDSGRMPLLRARAEAGLVFEQFYAATSSTQPTHATIFTGREPWRHGVTKNGAVLEPEYETLAERLEEEGFATAAVVASFPLERRFGFEQGFDTYDDRFEHQQSAQGKPMQVWSGVDVREDEFYSLADTITAKAIAVLEAARADKQFFWFHYFDPHAPYGDSQGGDSQDSSIALTELTSAAAARSADFAVLLERSRTAYDADVRRLDRALDRLLARLADDAERFETHVLVTSDHGESFGEEGELGHGKRLIRSQVHVPTFLLSPRVRAGTLKDPAGSVDVMPTVLALAGVKRDPRLPGRDLAVPPDGEPPPALGMRRTFAKPFRDVRTDGSVVLVFGPQFYLVRAGRLFIGDAEKVESEDPAADPEFLAQVAGLFSAFEAELARGTGHEDLAPETQRALEALGYTR